MFSQEYSQLSWSTSFPLARWEEDERPVVWVPHLGVDVLLHLRQPSVLQRLQHDFVGNLKISQLYPLSPPSSLLPPPGL